MLGRFAMAAALLLAGCDPQPVDTGSGVNDTLPEDSGGCIELLPWYLDSDGDGHGNPDVGQRTCEAPTGTVALGDDCDDADAAVLPGAPELCNGLDDDCDGEVDNHPVAGTTVYTDADGDGYGDPATEAFVCEPLSDAVFVADDCDDADAAVNPDATERCLDEVDQNCDGALEDGCPVCSLIVPDDATTVQAGINAASDGDVVCVRPGTWFEHLDFLGKAIEVVGPTGAENTVIDAGKLTNVVRFTTGEGPDSILRGFTLTHGHAEKGGGIYVVSASPTLADLRITDNACYGTTGGGGGLFLNEATVAAEGLVVSGNTSAVDGGGIYASGGSLSMDDSVVSGNEATGGSGGGIYALEDVIRLHGTTVSDNVASDDGGGIFAQRAGGSFEVVELTGNKAGHGDGGGLYGSSVAGLSLTDLLVSGNSARNGGGLYLSAWASVLLRAELADNIASAAGGGLSLSESSPSVESLYAHGNVAETAGGGLVISGGSPTFDQVVVQNNVVTCGSGGGLTVVGATTPGFTHLIVDGNTAGNASCRTAHGGGVYVDGAEPTFHATRFVGNEASATNTARGGGIDAAEDAVLNLSGAVIAGNRVTIAGAAGSASGAGLALLGRSIRFVDHAVITANEGAEGLYLDASTSSFRYCDLWGNPDGDFEGPASPVGASGNVAADPVFLDTTAADPADWDVHLATTSSLVDAGDPAEADVDGSRRDIGLHGGEDGATWDRDGDGFPLWWQPGAYDSATYPALDWDCDDRDAGVSPGAGC